jgi:hypothetical protein
MNNYTPVNCRSDEETTHYTIETLNKLNIKVDLDTLYEDYTKGKGNRKYVNHFKTISQYCRNNYGVISENPYALGRYYIGAQEEKKIIG